MEGILEKELFGAVDHDDDDDDDAAGADSANKSDSTLRNSGSRSFIGGSRDA